LRIRQEEKGQKLDEDFFPGNRDLWPASLTHP
jgi:hypothetical protein